MNKFHEHDCECCHYLGSDAKKSNLFDYYLCEQGGSIPTVIARYGNADDYTSGLDFVKHCAKKYVKTHTDLTLAQAVLVLCTQYDTYQGMIELVEAAARAIEQGFFDENLAFNGTIKAKTFKP